MVEGPAGCRAVGEEQVSRESLNVIEVMHLVALLELLDHALEPQMDEVQVLQVAHLCLEREVVLVGSGPLKAFWQRDRQGGERGLPVGRGRWGGGVVQQQGDPREVQQELALVTRPRRLQCRYEIPHAVPDVFLRVLVGNPGELAYARYPGVRRELGIGEERRFWPHQTGRTDCAHQDVAQPGQLPPCLIGRPVPLQGVQARHPGLRWPSPCGEHRCVLPDQFTEFRDDPMNLVHVLGDVVGVDGCHDLLVQQFGRDSAILVHDSACGLLDEQRPPD